MAREDGAVTLHTPVIIEITDTTTGEMRSVPDAWGFDDDPNSQDRADEFLWSDGNNACDCNRHLLFDRAVGIENEDRQCGEDRFSVVIKARDGTVLYEDGK